MESLHKGRQLSKAVDGAAEHVRNMFVMFLEEYLPANAQGQPNEEKCYLVQIQQMKQEDRTTLFVNYEDVVIYDENLANAILEDYYRMESYLRKALQLVVRKHNPEYVVDREKAQKEFWISFHNLPTVRSLREVRTTHVGQLFCLKGTVTRTSEVRPELIYGTFSCDLCHTKVYDVEQQFKYTEPLVCPNPLCGNRIRWHLHVEQSKFIDWQKIRIQENASEIPPGSMPRGIDVVVRNEIVDRAKAGDKCLFTGTLIVVPDITQLTVAGEKVQIRKGGQGEIGGRSTSAISRANDLNDGITGMKSMGPRELTYKLCFLACMVQPTDARFGTLSALSDDLLDDDNVEKILEQFDKHELEEIARMRHTPQLYQRLVDSIVPTVHGHDEIKRGILLMLFGGVPKRTIEGIRLRGDINVCIVGDPSTSKSQFLKFVSSFILRSIYTSGKASSAAGLTASVIRDEETNQFSIEAGALMLADNGICCIDEFDKMDIGDQVAIHEAMEQQTISIAKAGIRATLNARASILAAANPVDGRYNRSKSLRQNVNMSAAIMSRFDLFFVVLDECDDTMDYNIARHILNLHQRGDDGIHALFTPSQIQRYIRFARTLKPQLSTESSQFLVEYYKQLRWNDSAGKKSSYRITVRQLESMIRLSEALARLHCDDEIRPKYVKEAFRLLKKSIIHIESEDIALDDGDNALENSDGPVSRGMDPTDSLRGTALDAQHSETMENMKPRPVRISYEQYHQIASSIVLYLRQHSDLSIPEPTNVVDKAADGGVFQTPSNVQHSSHHTHIKQSQLIAWYLNSIEEDISTEQELLEHHRLIKLILHRLIHRDHVLVEVKGSSYSRQHGHTTMEGTSEIDDPVLFVHPNFVLDGMDE